MNGSIFDYVNENRELVLGQNCVLHLRSFITGLQEGFHRCKSDWGPEMKRLALFRQRMTTKYDYGADDCLAIYRASPSPSASLDLYFNEWKSFLREEGHRIAEYDIPRPEISGVLNLESFLSALRQRPKFYIFSKSTAHLKALFSGISTAVRLSRAEVSLRPNLEEFSKWLSEEYKFKCSWDMFLTARAVGDDEFAFDQFFGFMDDFLAAHP